MSFPRLAYRLICADGTTTQTKINTFMPEERPGAAEAPILLDTEQVATLLGCHPESVNRLRRRGELPAYYLGHRMLRFHQDDVLAWLEKFRHQAPPASRKRPSKDTAAGC